MALGNFPGPVVHQSSMSSSLFPEGWLRSHCWLRGVGQNAQGCAVGEAQGWPVKGSVCSTLPVGLGELGGAGPAAGCQVEILENDPLSSSVLPGAPAG